VCALRELARVLRIGGRIIITVWAMERRHRKVYLDIDDEITTPVRHAVPREIIRLFVGSMAQFESQDVLMPWHKPCRNLDGESTEFSTTTTTSDEEYVGTRKKSNSDSITLVYRCLRIAACRRYGFLLNVTI